MLLFRGFDTEFDTKKIAVSIKHHFYIRKEVSRFGLSQVYLSVSKGRRVRLRLGVEGSPLDWLPKKQRFRENCQYNLEQNMVLDTIFSHITEIITTYRLQRRMLSLSKFIDEYNAAIPKRDFVSFFGWMLENSVKENVGSGTYGRHKAVLEKIKAWKPEILFHEMDEELLKCFTRHLAVSLKNKSTTVNSNLAVVKKYVSLAEKNKIPMAIGASDIKIGSTSGGKINLKAEEVKRLREFYFSQFINDSQRIILGYFLFSCFTGLRLGDIKDLNRKDILKDSFLFVANKTKRWKSFEKELKITTKLQKIILHEPKLFVLKFTGEYMNRELKLMAKFLHITKNISMHVGRHTFATNYLRAGGTVEKLQNLLGHSKITETMGYVHVVSNEAQEEVLWLDELY